MKAKALICSEENNFSVENVFFAQPKADEVVIKNFYSGISIGTEFSIINKKVNWGEFPVCTGYMGTGVIESIGDKIKNFSVGDKVYYRKNNQMFLTHDGTPVSAAAGVHCSKIITNPDGIYGIGKLPNNIDMATACMFVLPAVGLHGVNMPNPKLNDIVLVNGCGMIGLGSIIACVNRGCRVIGIDINDNRLEIAKNFGAEITYNPSDDKDLEKYILSLYPDGVDLFIECTGIPDIINKTVSLCKTYGKYSWQGNYGEKGVLIDYQKITNKKLTMYFPSDDGLQHCRENVITRIQNGMLPWEKCLTHKVSAYNAPHLYERIQNGKEKEIMGALIKWENCE